MCRYVQEKWHPVEKSSRRESPSLRLKCQFERVEVLPLQEYEALSYFVRDEYKSVCRMLERSLPVRAKEELARELVSVLHGAADAAEDALAELVVEEVSPSSPASDRHLAFRANTITTKAVEAYLKLVGGRYLQATLQSVVRGILSSEDVDLEVDPARVQDPEALRKNQADLLTAVKQVRKEGNCFFCCKHSTRCENSLTCDNNVFSN